MLVLSPPCHPQILVANDKACQLLGYSSHNLIGQKLTQFFLKPDSDVVEALSEECVEADGRAAVVFGTVVSAGPSEGCPPGVCAGGLLSLVTVGASAPSALVCCSGGGREASREQKQCCCWPGVKGDTGIPGAA